MVKKPCGIRKGRKKICQARIAKTIGELERGLSGIGRIGKKDGLLLVFPLEGRWMNGIWMAWMRFHIDLIFISSEKRIVGIERELKPISLNPKTWKIYFPKKKAKYALELNAGCAEGLNEGDLLDFQS